MSRSTVVSNQVLGGNGGNGGFGGPGRFGGQDCGGGGNGAAAQGGGLLARGTLGATGPVGTVTNVTLARNFVQVGDAGFGSLGGQLTDADGNPTQVMPFRYAAETPGGVTTGGTRLLNINFGGEGNPDGVTTGTGAPTVDYTNHAVAIGDAGTGVDSIDVGVLSETAFTALTAFAGTLALGAANSAAAVALSGFSVALVPAVGKIELEGQVLTGVLTPVIGFAGFSFTAFAGFTAGAAVLSIGVVLVTNILIDGILTGDWEGAVERTIGNPGPIYPYNFSLLLGSVRHDDNDIVPSVGATGDNGAGLYGPLTLSRTAAAANTAARRALVRRKGGDQYRVSTQYDTVAAADVAGRAAEAGGANQTNLIGAVNGGFANSLKGTTASPLDARFDTQLRPNGGSLPTLKLLPLSPGRQAISGFSGTSQNGYV